MTLTWGPNSACRDFLALFEGDRWAEVRPFISRVRLHNDKCLPGPLYEQYAAAGVFSQLRRWGVPLMVEMPALKAWRNPDGQWSDPWGERARDEMRACVANVRAADGVISSILLDEPWTAAVSGTFQKDTLGYTTQNTARLVGSFIREAADQDCPCVLVEPFPHFTGDRLATFLRALVDAGEPPAGFWLDIDNTGWPPLKWWERWIFRRPYGLATADVQAALRRLLDVTHSLGLSTGLILIGHDATSQWQYASDHRQLSRELRFLASRTDEIAVMNWYAPDWLPAALPLTDRTSHLSLVGEEATIWQVAPVDPVPIPSPLPPPAPSLPRLAIDGTRWKAGAAWWRWRGVDGFALLRLLADGQTAHVEAYLAWMAAQDVTVIRVLTTVRWLPLPPADGQAHLADLLRRAQAHGLYVEVVALADTALKTASGYDRDTWAYDPHAHARDIRQLCAASPNSLFEVANEPDHQTQHHQVADPVWLHNLAPLTRVPSALGAAHGSQDSVRTYIHGDYVTVHGDRADGDDGWRWVRHTNEQRAMMDSINKPVVNDEPSKDMRDPAKHLALGIFCAMHGLGDTFHGDQVLYGQIPTGAELACFDARRRGWAAIPPAWHGQYRNTGHGGSPTRSFTNATRVYSSVQGGGGYTLAMGVRPGFAVAWNWSHYVLTIDTPTVKLWDVGI